MAERLLATYVSFKLGNRVILNTLSNIGNNETREIQNNDASRSDNIVVSDDVNWDARASREHLYPACAVERGLDYGEYYNQNQNAPIMVENLKKRRYMGGS